MNHHTPSPEAEARREEYASLGSEIAEWRQWWGELSEMGDPHFGEMGDRLARFREHLSAHFQHEERPQFPPLKLGLSQEVARQLTALEAEHGRLLAELDQLVDRLHACQSEYTCWGNARQDFEAFLDRLDVHERAEDDLIGRKA